MEYNGKKVITLDEFDRETSYETIKTGDYVDAAVIRMASQHIEYSNV